MSIAIGYLINFVNYGMITILILGLIGNSFTFIVYRSNAFKSYSVSIYFTFMAITDSLTLANVVLFFLDQQFHYTVYNLSSVACKLSFYSSYVFAPISAWLTVMVSIDRFFNIVYPRRFPFVFKPKFQVFVSLAIIAFNVLYYTSILTNFDLNPISSDIDPVTNETIVAYFCSANDGKINIVINFDFISEYY